MEITSEDIKDQVKKLFDRGTIRHFIGYEPGADNLHVTPCFIEDVREVSRLLWSPLCIYNLSKYLLHFRNEEGRVGILVKGCDARSLVELIKQNQVNRDKVFILGVACTGQIDPDKLRKITSGTVSDILRVEDNGSTFRVISRGGIRKADKAEILQEKCLVCKYPTPVIYDNLMGEPVMNLPWVTDDYGLVREQERLSSEEKADYWNKQFSQCIRCYACRNICPVCTCEECIFDKRAPRWLGKSTRLSENQLYHLIRAFHIAGRCTDCGECERACPIKIPLRKLNKKLEKDILELFSYVAGTDVEQPPPLTMYQLEDKDEFI